MKKKQFKAESKKLLDMMIHSIYTHKEIFLRELISNASDAIDKLCYLSLTDPNVGMSRSDFHIDLSIDKEKRLLTVADNGIGMTREELENNLGVIAHSGSLEFKDALPKEKDEAEQVDIIGQFGVGFYSAFMVSDQVTVLTRAYDSEEGYRWQSDGADGYTIEPIEKQTVGTEIIMQIKADTESDHYSEFLEEYRIRQLVHTYSDYIRFPIRLADQTLNSMVPLWQRNKSEIKKEEYEQFYQEKFLDSNPPLCTIHTKVEGAVSYQALLYIPSKAPYGYYTKEVEKGLQLYSSGVLIMEKCADLLPDYFRFVKGVVDSQDLSLNISRELLQHDRQLKLIASNLEKKIKNELVKLMEQDRPAYRSFFGEFGLQLKYGMVSDFGTHRDQLCDLMLFYSGKRRELISLKDYVQDMAEGQSQIYYACGPSVEQIDSLPQMDQVRGKDYDVLYLTEEVDEFVMQVLGTYEEKPFQSVNNSDLDLMSDEEKKKLEETIEKNRPLLDFVKQTLGDALSDVKLSSKLKTHPVCLSSASAVSLEMEKYFSVMPGENKIKADRVLELNAEHPVFAALQRAYENDPDKAADYARLLYQQALLIAGMPLPDVTQFTEEICRLMV